MSLNGETLQLLTIWFGLDTILNMIFFSICILQYLMAENKVFFLKRIHFYNDVFF